MNKEKSSDAINASQNNHTVEWKECKLGGSFIEIIDGDRGKNYPTHDEFLSFGYCLFLSTKNVKQNGFDFSDCQFISKEKDEILRKGKLQRNDLVLTTRGTIGNVAFYSPEVPYENIRINSGMVIIRPDTKQIHPIFNFYVFRNLEKNFSTYISGSAQPQLPIRDLIQIPILLPPLPEQQAIAEVLSSLDDKIDLLHRQNKTLEQLAETLFSEKLKVNSEKWVERPFSQLIATTLGGDWGKESPEGEFQLQVCCIRGTDIADLQTGLPNRTPIRFIKEKKFENIRPLSGDLILEISGGTDDQSTGRCIYINEINISLFPYPLIFSNFCRLIRPLKKEYSYFLYLYIQHLYKKDEFFNLENGSSGIKNLDYKYLLNELKFLLPVLESEIIEFNNQVKIYFEKIDKNKTQIRTLTQLRDTLLPKLMSGEVRVNH